MLKPYRSMSYINYKIYPIDENWFMVEYCVGYEIFYDLNSIHGSENKYFEQSILQALIADKMSANNIHSSVVEEYKEKLNYVNKTQEVKYGFNFRRSNRKSKK